MNRSFNVILGGFGATDETSGATTKNKDQLRVEMLMMQPFNENASSVIIVPGYGMAVAQAQHALREMVDTLKKMTLKFISNSSCGRKNAWTHERIIS